MPNCRTHGWHTSNKCPQCRAVEERLAIAAQLRARSDHAAGRTTRHGATSDDRSRDRSRSPLPSAKSSFDKLIEHIYEGLLESDDRPCRAKTQKQAEELLRNLRPVQYVVDSTNIDKTHAKDVATELWKHFDVQATIRQGWASTSSHGIEIRKRISVTLHKPLSGWIRDRHSGLLKARFNEVSISSVSIYSDSITPYWSVVPGHGLPTDDDPPDDLVTLIENGMRHCETTQHHIAEDRAGAEKLMSKSGGVNALSVLDKASVTREFAETVARALWNDTPYLRQALERGLQSCYLRTPVRHCTAQLRPHAAGWLKKHGSSEITNVFFSSIVIDHIHIHIKDGIKLATLHWYPINSVKRK